MSTPVKTSAKSHPARKYTIKELLRMRITIPFVCCPLDRFGPDAYTYGIIKVYLVNQHPVLERSPVTASYDRSTATNTPARPQITHLSDGVHRQPRNPGVRNDPQPQRKGGNNEVIQSPGGHLFPPAHVTGEFRRYVSSPMPVPVPVPGSFDQSSMDPLRQGILRNVARFYPQTAAALTATYRNMNPPIYAGYPAPSQTHAGYPVAPSQPSGYQGVQSMPPGYPVHSHPPKVQRHGVGAMNPMDLSAASHRAGAMNLEIPGTGFPQHPVVPGDMHFSGGYPAVTIGAAGYGRGNSPQGFVPGGSLKTIPMTGLTPTAEKNEPVWENIPRPPPSPPLESGSKQYDPNNWVKQANKSAFPVLNEGNDFHQESKSGSFGNILAVTSQIKLNKPLAPSHTASIGKGKAREIPEAIEQIPLPPPPPPMLGTTSNREHQLAFIEFMKKRNRSTSRNPTQFKENDGPSVTDDGQADGNNGKSGW